MPLKYRLVTRKILSGPDRGKEKVFAVARSSYKVDTDSLARGVAMFTHLHEIDVKCVLHALKDVIRMELKHGASVQLGDVGWFKLIIHSEGANSINEFSKKNIKQVKVNFQPGRKLCPSLEEITFEKEDTIPHFDISTYYPNPQPPEEE